MTEPAPTPADVGVVIVNYRAAADVERCVASLRPDIDRGLRVVVVDNDSGDGSVDRLAPLRGDRVTLLPAPNDGFAGGNNRGAAALAAMDAPPTFLWFLNPDCEVERGATDALVAAASADPQKVWGALIVERDAPDVIQCAAGYRYQPCLTRMTPLRRVEELDRLDYVSGASMFLGRELFERVGGFWTDLFLYYEEIDLCRRVAAVGGGVGGAMDAVVRHAGGTSTGGKATGRRRASPVAEYHANLSALLFTWRHHRRCFPIAAPARFGFKAVQLVGSGQLGLLRSLIAAYWAFLRRALVRR